MDDDQSPDKKTDDSEDIINNVPDDITSVISSLGLNTFKTAILLFILFILVSSDVFIDRVLSSSDNAYVEGRSCTVKGTIVQGLIISLGFILIHALVNSGYI